MLNRNKSWQIVALRGFPYLTREIQSHYVQTNITIANGRRRSQKTISIDKGALQGCLLTSMLFNLYLNHVIIEWQDSNLTQCNILITFLFLRRLSDYNCIRISLPKILHQ
jgi:hypothetical protein